MANIEHIQNKELLTDLEFHRNLVKSEPLAVFMMRESMKNNSSLIFESVRSGMLTSGYLITHMNVSNDIKNSLKGLSQRKILSILNRFNLDKKVIWRFKKLYPIYNDQHHKTNPLIRILVSCLDKKHLYAYRTKDSRLTEIIKDEIQYREVGAIKKIVSDIDPMSKRSRRTLPTASICQLQWLGSNL